MRTLAGLVMMFALVGCGAETPPPATDAPTDIDAAALPACTGAAYDPCTDNAQCDSQNCRLFMSDGIQICTATCDASNPCPDFDGAPVACNMMGRCNPRAANMCMR
jgi:hypothetical protein